MTRQNREAEDGARLALFLASVVMGTVAGSGFHETLDISPGAAAVGGLFIALVNPFVAALAASVCEQLRSVAFPATYSPWPVWIQTVCGAGWPVALIYWAVVAVFFTTINRAFPSSPPEPPTVRGTPESRKLPPFVIEVGRADANRDVKLSNLTITHPGCGGGTMKPERDEKRLVCTRCHVSFSFEPGENTIGAICRVALDGGSRVMQLDSPYRPPSGYSEVHVRLAGEPATRSAT